MKQLLMNILRTCAYLAICALVGYYNFQSSGWLGIATNILYLVIGILLAETWLKARNKFEPISDKPSSNETDIAAQSVESPVETAKGEMDSDTFTLTPKN
jgi:sulfite exporter TauE/SafE